MNRASTLTTAKKPAVLLVTALLLVGGVDAATYAAGGASLLLGANNSVHGTTSLKNTGAGPALNLTSRPGSAPLKVSSRAKVARLNADAVDGKGAADLEPATQVWRVGVANGTVVDNVRTPMRIAPGRYVVTWRLTALGASSTTYCWVAPDSELSTGDYDNLVSATTPAGGFTAISASGEITVPAADDFVFECEGDDLTLRAPITVTAQRIATPAKGVVLPPTRPGRDARTTGR